MSIPRHPGLSEYLTHHSITSPGDRADGAIVLVIDELHRVYCRPAPRGELVFETKIVDMPDDRGRSDELVEEALQFAHERMEADCDETLVLTQDERTLCLQQHLAADADMDAFEVGLGDFANAIGAWRARLRVS